MLSLEITLEQSVIQTEEPVIAWMIKHASTLANRCAIGKDGKTSYGRRIGKNSMKPLVEVGQQVLAKPVRTKSSRRRRALKPQWVEATLVGLNARTGEHHVVLAKGGVAIRVRIVKRRAADEQWSVSAINDFKAILKTPNLVHEG